MGERGDAALLRLRRVVHAAALHQGAPHRGARVQERHLVRGVLAGQVHLQRHMHRALLVRLCDSTVQHEAAADGPQQVRRRVAGPGVVLVWCRPHGRHPLHELSAGPAHSGVLAQPGAAVERHGGRQRGGG